jgi:hypothetical protein
MIISIYSVLGLFAFFSIRNYLFMSHFRNINFSCHFFDIIYHTLWWVEQWIDQRQQEIKSTGTPADIDVKTRTPRTYKDWAFRNKKKAEAGMRFIRGTTPDRPAVGVRNAAARAD